MNTVIIFFYIELFQYEKIKSSNLYWNPSIRIFRSKKFSLLLLHPVETYHVKFMHDRGCWWLTGCLTCYKTWSWQLPQNIDNLILRGIAPYTRIFYAHSSGLCRCLHFLLKDKLIFCKWMMLLIFSLLCD